MKRIYILLCILCIATVTKLNAQKIGFVNFSVLIDTMPEKDTVQMILMEIQNQFYLELQATEKEIKVAEADRDAFADTSYFYKLRQAKIDGLKKTYQEKQEFAQYTLEAKKQEMLQPLLQKAKDAVGYVAKTKGYTQILDLQVMYYTANPADDLTNEVIKQIRLKKKPSTIKSGVGVPGIK